MTTTNLLPSVEQRTASLLPALMLAHVDGKSLLECLTKDEQKALVRKVVCPLIKQQPKCLQQ